MASANILAASLAGNGNAGKTREVCNPSKEFLPKPDPYHTQKSLYAFPFNFRLACHTSDHMRCQSYRRLLYRHNKNGNDSAIHCSVAMTDECILKSKRTGVLLAAEHLDTDNWHCKRPQQHMLHASHKPYVSAYHLCQSVRGCERACDWISATGMRLDHWQSSKPVSKGSTLS